MKTYTQRVWDEFADKVVYLYNDLGLNEEEISERLNTSLPIVQKVVDDYNNLNDS